MSQQPGYIYLMKAGEHYKIGKSTNVAQRMRQFQLPMPVALLHTVAVLNMSQAETYLHKRFADRRGRGEWFTLSPNDVAWICSLETLDPLPELPQTELPARAPKRAYIMSDDQELWSTQQAAHYLETTRQSVHELAQRGEIGRRVGRAWVFTKAELDAWLEKPRPKGGRPPKKSDAAVMTPVGVV